MGKNSKAWEYVQTSEDHKKIAVLAKLYAKNASKILETNPTIAKIPHILHWIWLGPKPFPENAIAYLVHWKEKHPNWTLKFWTDLDRMPPLPGMEKCLVADFPFSVLAEAYYDSASYWEKAKILSYEILFREGGISLDHDTMPVKAFETLTSSLDFFCGLNELGPTVMSSSVIPSPHLIGSRPRHPVIGHAMSWLKDNWEILEKSYPGITDIAVRNRIEHRIMGALTEGIDQKANKGSSVDLVFPTNAFNALSVDQAQYAAHFREGHWKRPPTSYEKKVEKDFSTMIRRDNEAVFLILIMAILSFVALAALLVLMRTKQRSA